MHEVGIARSLLDIVLAKVQERNTARVKSITLDIGVLSGVEQDPLEFAFTALSEGTQAQGAKLIINSLSLRCYCGQCGEAFESEPFDYTCPGCGNASGEIINGKEMNLISMEVA